MCPVMLVCIIILITGCIESNEETGEKAPNFTMESTDGIHYNLTDFLGEITLLIFMFSSCTACKRSIEESAVELDPSLDANIIAVSIIPGSNEKSDLAELKEETNAHFLFVQASDEVMGLYGFSEFPHHVFITAKGYIEHSGSYEAEELRSMLIEMGA